MNRKNNLLELPGMADVHVHLKEPGGMQKEDFETGTKAAVAGGYTQILDMPNSIPPTISSGALNDKFNRANERIWCDLGFNFGATADSTKYFLQISKKVFGLKVYMNQTTGTLLIDKLADRDLIFKSWQSDLPIMVHAEGETVDVAIKLAKKYKKNLHVCHIADNHQINSIRKARSEGVKISCEVTPHHLFLTKSDVRQLGPLGIMKPPLPTKTTQKKLWDNIDSIDMISTDHAPHTLAEKYSKSPPFGVPGLETTLPLMLTAVSRGLLTFDRLIQMTSVNPRNIFHLPVQPNTFVIVDPSKKFKITNKGLFTKCGWTPFVGLPGRGELKKVVIRGQTVFENGKFQGHPQGKVIYPI